MIPADFFVEVADFSTDRDAIAAVREPVFVAEQSVPSEIVWDALDPRCRHVVARDLEGNPIGVGRLTPTPSIGRLAVLPAWRGRGVGRALLQTLVDLARQMRLPSVELHAQIHALPFYQKAGFVAEGDVYEEAGIPHQSMRLDLGKQPPLERSEPVPNAESAEIEFDSLQTCRAALLPVLKQARRQLYIHTRALDPELLCGEEVLAEIRRVATAGRGAEVRILLQDPAAAMHDGAPLLGIAQRLSSTVKVRQPEDEIDHQFPGAYILNDQAGLLFRPIGSRYEGGARHYAPGHHRQLMEQFRHAWDRSAPASAIRAQGL